MAPNRAHGGEDRLRKFEHTAGFGERFVRLFKANVNEALNKAEDPEKMLNQIVEDMQVRNQRTCPRCSPAATLPPPLCCAAANESINMQPIEPILLQLQVCAPPPARLWFRVKGQRR